MTKALTLRPAQKTDAMFLFQLTNDPLVRSNSFSSQSVSLEDHLQWFDRKLNDPSCLLWVVEATGKPAGQVRFDFFSPDQCEISLSLSSDFRGQKLSAPTIQLAVNTLRQARSLDEIHARIKKENLPSQKAFQACGFVLQGEEASGNQTCLRYTLRVNGKN